MRAFFTKLFSPILNRFESGSEVYTYKRSHRVILVVIGCLFFLLAVSVVTAGVIFSQWGALLPSVIFTSVSVVCLVVALLGSDRAVSRIWSSK